MKQIKVKDKEFSLFIEKEEIQEAVKEVAREISEDLKDKNPLFLVVLNGAFIFAADLLRHVEVDCNVSFVKLSSYAGTQTTSIVREIIGLDEVVKGRTVVIIEDIVDTGITMDNMIRNLKHLEADDVQVATLLFKPEAFQKEFSIKYIGIEIPNDFIVGYGLDYDGYGRNHPDIYKIIE
ncbi:MAG: hypoxanthine phosphoribosyltransferase [Bacteroidales bacterium]|nr:hypoxanthine phosphoribosyltransferase [Bacteroidales bacterium]